MIGADALVVRPRDDAGLFAASRPLPPSPSDGLAHSAVPSGWPSPIGRWLPATDCASYSSWALCAPKGRFESVNENP